MIDMVLGGMCQNCGKSAPALVSCRACGARICHMCFNPQSGFCRICGGTKKV